MKRIGISWIAAVLGAVVLAPADGHAFDQPGCHGNYRSSASCRFVFDGMPVSVFGQANTSNAPVKVWITLDGWPEIVLLECSGAGRCEDDLHAEGLLEDRLPPQVTHPAFRCYVQGTGTGTYSCRSGTDPPSGA